MIRNGNSKSCKICTFKFRSPELPVKNYRNSQEKITGATIEPAGRRHLNLNRRQSDNPYKKTTVITPVRRSSLGHYLATSDRNLDLVPVSPNSIFNQTTRQYRLSSIISSDECDEQEEPDANLSHNAIPSSKGTFFGNFAGKRPKKHFKSILKSDFKSVKRYKIVVGLLIYLTLPQKVMVHTAMPDENGTLSE